MENDYVECLFVKYQHHGRDAWVRDDLKGKHREHCLCYHCKNFRPGDDEWMENCPIANLVFSVCVSNRVLLPVWECEKFIEIIPGKHRCKKLPSEDED